MKGRAMRSRWFLSFLLVPYIVSAHMLDPRSIDRYSEILLSPEGGRVYYVLIYGQNGTDSANNALDLDKEGKATPESQEPYLAQRNSEYLPGQTLEIDSRAVELRYLGGVTGTVRAHGGMHANRAVLTYEFDYPDNMARDAAVPFHYEDRNFVRLFAWKQVRVVGLQGVEVRGHQPYSDIAPYDYTVLDLGGFLPATRSVTLETVVPSNPVSDATSSDSYAEALMEVGVPAPPMTEMFYFKRTLQVGVPIVLLVGAVVVVRNRRKHNREHH
ncbi:MAG: hypothetical protein ABIH23_33485 [bacterium]